MDRNGGSFRVQGGGFSSQEGGYYSQGGSQNWQRVPPEYVSTFGNPGNVAEPIQKAEVEKQIDEIKGTNDYYKWTQAEEVALLEAMKMAKAAGHKSQQGFRKEGWPFMLTHMKVVFPDSKLTVDNIKNHVKTWRQHLLAVLALKGKSGTGWCDVKQKFDCTTAVWLEACKKHPGIKGKRKTHWVYFKDWVEIYGTDRASGKKVLDFQTAAKKILADDRYKSIVADSCTVDEDETVGPGSNVPGASDSTGKNTRKRVRNVMDVDKDFLDAVKNIFGPPPTAVATENLKDLRTKRLEGLNEELKKFPQLPARERIMIGDIIANAKGKLEHFYSLNHDDREEYLKVELIKMNQDAW